MVHDSEEMVRVSNQDLCRIIQALEHNVNVAMDSFELSEHSSKEFEKHRKTLRKLQFDMAEHLAF